MEPSEEQPIDKYVIMISSSTSSSEEETTANSIERSIEYQEADRWEMPEIEDEPLDNDEPGQLNMVEVPVQDNEEFEADQQDLVNPPGLDEIEDFFMNNIQTGYESQSDDENNPAHYDANGNYYYNKGYYEYSSGEGEHTNTRREGGLERDVPQDQEITLEEEYGLGWETDEAGDDYMNMVIGEVGGVPFTQHTSFVFENLWEEDAGNQNEGAEIHDEEEIAEWIVEQVSDDDGSSTTSSPTE